MDRAGAIHCHVLHDAALHQVNHQPAQALLHHVPAMHQDQRLAAPMRRHHPFHKRIQRRALQRRQRSAGAEHFTARKVMHALCQRAQLKL